MKVKFSRFRLSGETVNATGTGVRAEVEVERSIRVTHSASFCSDSHLANLSDAKEWAMSVRSCPVTPQDGPGAVIPPVDHGDQIEALKSRLRAESESVREARQREAAALEALESALALARSSS
jgi:hypothetical protein